MTTPNQSVIEELQYSIECLNSTINAMRVEIAFLRGSLSKMDASLEKRNLSASDYGFLSRGRPMTISKWAADRGLLCKVAAFTNALEDKIHQLSACNRNQFGRKTNRKSTRRVDSHIRTSGFISGILK